MARKRDIDPAIWENEQLASVPRDARLLFIACVSQADDEGRLKGSGRYLKAKAFPYDDDIGPAVVADWRDTLVAAGLLCAYAVGSDELLHMPTWHKWQKLNRRFPSRLPECPRPHETPAVSESSSTTHAPVSDDSLATVTVTVTGPLPEPIPLPGPSRARAEASAADAAPPDIPIPKIRPPNPNGLGPLVDAFRDLGLPPPNFEGKEAQAANQLVKAHPPDRIAQCWQEIASGEFGGSLDQIKLSFSWLNTSNLFVNWLGIKEGRYGKPKQHGRNGSANGLSLAEKRARGIIHG